MESLQLRNFHKTLFPWILEDEMEVKSLLLPDIWNDRIDCSICLNAELEFISFHECWLPMCRECTRTWMITQIYEGRVMLTCVCNGIFKDEEVAQTVPTQLFSNYIKKKTLETCKKDTSLKLYSCDGIDCPSFWIIKNSDLCTTVQCIYPSCKRLFCLICRATHHNQTCQDYQKLLTTSTRQKQNNMTKRERQSENYIKKKTKLCPVCNTPIQKTDGCNHMICVSCTTHFCWVCSGPFDGHFHEKTKRIRLS